MPTDLKAKFKGKDSDHDEVHHVRRHRARCGRCCVDRRHSKGWSKADGDTTAHNKATIERSFDAWAAGTGGPYDLLADNAKWTIVGRSAVARTYPSREAFLSEVIRPFNARMRDPLKPSVRDIYADGDVVIALFDASGVARDGIPYSNTYSWYLRCGKAGSSPRLRSSTASPSTSCGRAFRPPQTLSARRNEILSNRRRRGPPERDGTSPPSTSFVVEAWWRLRLLTTLNNSSQD